MSDSNTPKVKIIIPRPDYRAQYKPKGAQFCPGSAGNYRADSLPDPNSKRTRERLARGENVPNLFL